MPLVWLGVVLSITTAFAACSAADSPSAESDGGHGGSGGALAGQGGGLVDLDGGTDAPPTGARFVGTVWGPHPDGKPALFPVPGALVIASADAPATPPACNTCVEVPAGSFATTSAADGSFVLDVPVGSTVYLTVQKGQFQRSRLFPAPHEIGTVTVDAETTSLPHRRVPELGDLIPRIALVYGDYDHMEDVLAKVGIGTESASYGHTWGSEAGYFDVYDNSGPGEEKHGANLLGLLSDPAKLAQYDVILFSCSYNANFEFMTKPGVAENLKDFVWKGGKLYVSDYAMPVAEIAWPEFAWFTDPLHGGCDEAQFPPNCNHGPPFDAKATPKDEALGAWLGAMGQLDGLVMKENWDTIGGIAPGYSGDDPDTMQPVYESPKVWVEGPWSYTPEDLTGTSIDPATFDSASLHPLTLSWRYNCGRVLFTTYHTVGTTGVGKHPGLLPQEATLFYLLMELTVCQDQPVIE